MGTEEIETQMDIKNWYSGLVYDQWVALPVSGPRPLARYKHVAAVVDEKLYISGGSRNGRYLSDIQVFDFRNLVWSTLKPYKDNIKTDNIEENSYLEALPPTSGHNMIKWGKKLLLLGGHSKFFSDNVTVWFIDVETYHHGVMETSGKVPIARAGQSVTLLGARLIMFGGEDVSRRLLNDIHILDLETMTWNLVETTQTPPAPRFDHIAAVHAERYLIIFGGCSHATCFNDLHVLDLQAMEWSQPQFQGVSVTPRAGHSGIAIDENWYIVGGGDNKSGASETLMLNMSKLVWSVITSVEERDPLASEGITACSALVDGEKYLVAFGGYNGKYNNEVFVMRPKPRDLSHPKILQSPAAAAAAASVSAAYALTKSRKLDFMETVESNFTGLENRSSQQDFLIEIDATREEKKVLELSLEKIRAENSMMSLKIDENISTYDELSKELQSVQGQLITERSRCFNLEAQIAELQKMLSSLPSVENEVQLLRGKKSELEQDMELDASVHMQGSGGVWRWIAGGA